jgi:hypothetical protein
MTFPYMVNATLNPPLAEKMERLMPRVEPSHGTTGTVNINSGAHPRLDSMADFP